MKNPLIPKNEWLRQVAVDESKLIRNEHAIFDQITRLACHATQSPAAALTVIDGNRQFVKSSYGLHKIPRETPRAVSFCGHAILQSGIFVVNDTREDERFADNPFVVNAPGVRFYAGVPIKSGYNVNVGTLCIIDVVPRKLDEGQTEAMMDLAGLTEEKLSHCPALLPRAWTSNSELLAFNDRATHLWRLARRAQLPCSVFMISLDRFQELKALWTDEHMRIVAHTLKGLISETCSDLNFLLSDIKFDRFMLLVIGIDNKKAQQLAESIRINVAALGLFSEARKFEVLTVSIGYAGGIDENRNEVILMDLWEQAHEAATQAKAVGGNRVRSIPTYVKAPDEGRPDNLDRAGAFPAQLLDVQAKVVCS